MAETTTTTSKIPGLNVARIFLNVDGKDIGFHQLMELSSHIELVEYVEGGIREEQKVMPGRAVPPTVTLQRRLAGDMSFASWQQALTGDQPAQALKTCELKMFNAENKLVARFVLEHAWPTKLEVRHQDDPVGGYVVETVTLVCRTLQRVAP